MANPNPPETDYIDNHDIVEIGDHPLLPDNHDARLVQAVLQLECDDASDRCQDAINSHASMITANATYFNHIKSVWIGLGAYWNGYKDFHKDIKTLTIVTEKFTIWLPQFLYRNNNVHILITSGRELGYKQLRRYALVEAKAYGFWDLYTINNLVLPCDSLNGPFISNNTQIYQCHTLLKMIRREQPNWDETLTVVQNFQQNPDWIYWYADILPFYTLWFNQYDRRQYFAKNAEQSGQRNLQSRNDNKPKNKFITKKEFFFVNKINALEKQLENAKAEIQRKENVIQYMQNNYYVLQQRLAALEIQHQEMLQPQMNHQAMLQQQINHQPFGYYYNAHP